jgi:hypothetical protein
MRARARLVSRGADEDAHDLSRGEVADDLRVDPRDRREAAGPVREPMRPDEPRGLVPLPLGGHCGSRARPASIEEAPVDARHRRRCAGRAGTASCGAPLPCARVDLADQDLLPVGRGLRDDDAEWGRTGYEDPQNSRRERWGPASRGPRGSPPPRRRRLAMACERCIVCQACSCRGAVLLLLVRMQPMAVG